MFVVGDLFFFYTGSGLAGAELAVRGVVQSRDVAARPLRREILLRVLFSSVAGSWKL